MAKLSAKFSRRSWLAGALAGAFVFSTPLATLGAEPLQPPREVDDLLEITFNHLKFDVKWNARFRREMLPKSIEELLGKRIRIRGYICPGAQEHMKAFMLISHISHANVVPVDEWIVVRMKGNQQVKFTTRPVTVEGTLSLDVIEDEDFERTSAIYQLDADLAR